MVAATQFITPEQIDEAINRTDNLRQTSAFNLEPICVNSSTQTPIQLAKKLKHEREELDFQFDKKDSLLPLYLVILIL